MHFRYEKRKRDRDIVQHQTWPTMDDERNNDAKSGSNNRRKQKFRENYSKEYPGIIVKSCKGEGYAYCTICRCDFTVSSGGLNDITRHIKNGKHTDNAKLSKEIPKISNFFTTENDVYNVTNAEVLFTEFIIEHSLPISVSDHAGKLFKKMFPDSKIASKYASARTKTSCIIDALSRDDKTHIVQHLKENAFSLATDGSTDYDDVKLYPICIRYYDNDTGHVLSVLLTLTECSEPSTGENIFKLIEKEIKDDDIPWDNFISFATDNASVMVGKHKGVAAFLCKKAPAVHINGCACHLMHLAASKASKCVPINVEDPLIEIYYYLEKSSKRKQSFKDMQEKHGVPMKKIVKHVPTRWLSLGKCLERLLEQYPAIVGFFEAEVAKEKTSKSVPKQKDPEKGKKSKSGEQKKDKVNESTCSKRPSSEKIVGKDKYSKRDTEKDEINANKKRPLSDKAEALASFKIPKLSDKSVAPSEKKESEKKSKAPTCKQDSKKTETKENEKKIKAPMCKDDSKKSETKGNEKKSETPTCKDYSKKTETKSKAKKILEDLKNVNTRLYWNFLLVVIPIFEKGNAFLQNEEPCIHKLHSVLCDQFSNLLVRFIKPECIQKSSIYDIDFENQQNQKSDEDLFIGSAAQEYLSKNEKCDRKGFLKTVRKFYITACQYMLKMFPFGDDVLINAEILDISKRCSIKFSQVQYFRERYPCIQSKTDKDKLEEEFLQYQISDLPSSVTECDRVDVAWNLLSQIIDPSTNQNKFPNLCTVAKSVLVIYHSNADCERLFSIVNKNKTEFRSCLSTKTLGNLMTRRMMLSAKGTPCFATEHDQKLLQRCKSATSQLVH